MILKKYDYKERRYKNITVPSNWNCITYSSDMDEIVNCPHCGRKIPFGDTYCSMEIHDRFGMGYAVCEECYQEEGERRTSSDYQD